MINCISIVIWSGMISLILSWKTGLIGTAWKSEIDLSVILRCWSCDVLLNCTAMLIFSFRRSLADTFPSTGMTWRNPRVFYNLVFFFRCQLSTGEVIFGRHVLDQAVPTSRLKTVVTLFNHRRCQAFHCTGWADQLSGRGDRGRPGKGLDHVPWRDHYDWAQEWLCGAHLQWTVADGGGKKDEARLLLAPVQETKTGCRSMGVSNVCKSWHRDCCWLLRKLSARMERWKLRS